MTEANWASLRDLLVARYDDFRKRLARRLGSDDLARESLHETYLQLSRTDAPALVLRPESYLFRIALNVAAGWRRTEARKATVVEIEAALEFADEAAHTEKIVTARFDLKMLEQAIEDLPPRQRIIFLAARVEERSIQEIADSLGISKRSVELELKRAIVHCAGRLDRPVIQRFGPRESETSYSMKDDGTRGDSLP